MIGFGRRIGKTLGLPSGTAASAATVVAVLVLAAAGGLGLVRGGEALPTFHPRGAAPHDSSAVPSSEGDHEGNPPPVVALDPAVRPLDPAAPAPTSQGVAAALQQAVQRNGLGTLVGKVVDPVSGAQLWSEQPGQGLTPGSTAKLMTASAVLLSTAHEHTWSTTVVRGSEPGTIVLVGGGDPTLSSQPAGQPTYYDGAARLDELVQQVKQSAAESGTRPKRVLVDTSLYSGPGTAKGWLPDTDIAAGYEAPVEPVMLDGGRTDPSDRHSARARKPAMYAGTELATRLGLPSGAVSLGAAPESASTIAKVQSPTIAELVEFALRESDNMLAEALARQVALSTDAEASFSAAADATMTVLDTHGFDTSGTHLADGSGLSTANRLTPNLATGLLAAAVQPQQAQQAQQRKPGQKSAQEVTQQLRPMLAALPVAGGTGTLANRNDVPAARQGRGWVRAKTGTLSAVNSLAGVVTDVDGRLLVFAMLSNGPSANQARPALDAVATVLRQCGCQ